MVITVSSPALAECLDTANKGEAIKCLEDKITNLTTQLEKKTSGKRFPKNAVVAFDASTCPDGWRTFDLAKGRVIVGVGRGNGLTGRILSDTGGEESHKLTEDEMPSHKHRTVEAGDTSNSSWGVGDGMNGRHGVRWQNPHATSNTAPIGGGKSHNNMPPFVVLLYCIKEALFALSVETDYFDIK